MIEENKNIVKIRELFHDYNNSKNFQGRYQKGLGAEIVSEITFLCQKLLGLKL